MVGYNGRHRHHYEVRSIPNGYIKTCGNRYHPETSARPAVGRHVVELHLEQAEQELQIRSYATIGSDNIISIGYVGYQIELNIRGLKEDET